MGGGLMRLFHNPRCSKSRECLALLEGREFEVVLYLDTGLEEAMLSDLIERFIDPLPDLIRIDFRGEPEHLIQMLLEDPSILQRPLLDDGQRVMVCRPPERALEWFS